MAFIRTQPITQQVNAIGALSQGEQLKKQRLGNKLLEAQTTPEALQENEKVRQFKLQALQAGKNKQEVEQFLMTSKRLDPFIRQIKPLQGNDRVQTVVGNIETFKRLGMDNEDIESLLDDNNLNNMILLNDASNQPKQTTLQQNAAFAFPNNLGKQREIVGGKISGPSSQTTVNVNTGEHRQAPTKTTLNKIQGKILDAEKSLLELGEISDTHSDEFLTTFGRFKANLGGALDKNFNSDFMGLAAFNAERSKFKSSVDQFFNQYRKEITGAAASEKELVDLKESLFSSDIGPREFKARYNTLMGKIQKNLKLNQKAAREGINVTPSKILFQGPDGQGVTEEDIKLTMKEEGMTRQEVLNALEAQ